MKRRFLVPTAVALTLHAILLFGFHRGQPAVNANDGLTPAVPPLPKDSVLLEWPPVPEDKDTPAAANGQPDAARPELPEPPVREAITTITIPVVASNPRPPDNRMTVANGPWGDPDRHEWFGAHGPRPVSPDHLDNPPRTRTQPAPVYPYEAKIDGRRGEVWVEFVVDETGKVLDPHVVRSNDPIFETPTLRAVSKWRFEPGRKNGQVVRFRMAVPVAFALNS